jgi:hypothetical protein
MITAKEARERSDRTAKVSEIMAILQDRIKTASNSVDGESYVTYCNSDHELLSAVSRELSQPKFGFRCSISMQYMQPIFYALRVEW